MSPGAPLLDEEIQSATQRPWQVLLFNCECHSMDEVVLQVQKATGCSLQQATEIMWKAHTEGQAVCYGGPLERCEVVAGKLQEIKLNVTIERA